MGPTSAVINDARVCQENTCRSDYGVTVSLEGRHIFGSTQ